MKNVGAPTESLQRELAEATLTQTRIRENVDSIEEELVVSDGKVEELIHQVSTSEDALAAEGIGYAKYREDLVRQHANAQGRLQEYQKRLRDMAGELLPMTLSLTLCSQLRDQLIEEQRHQLHSVPPNVVDTVIKEVASTIGSEGFWQNLPGSPKRADTQALRMRIIEVVGQTLTKNRNGSFKARHDLTEAQRNEIIQTLNTIIHDTPSAMSELSLDIHNLEATLQKIGEQLERIPENKVFTPILEKLNNKNRELSDARVQREAVNSRLRIENWKLTEGERQVKRLAEKIDEIHSKSRHLALAAKTRLALVQYEEDLGVARSQNIAEEVTNCLDMLLRKKQFIKRIEVNPKSYALHLFGKDETRISKNILSAGEKQVFAIAILWALSKVSGREIPIIIDTPLARLDSNHRHNLVTNYFPKAGKQVIIFTTDTEIDKQSYRLLEDKVARSYFLMSKNGEPSVIKHGYFSF